MHIDSTSLGGERYASTITICEGNDVDSSGIMHKVGLLIAQAAYEICHGDGVKSKSFKSGVPSAIGRSSNKSCCKKVPVYFGNDNLTKPLVATTASSQARVLKLDVDAGRDRLKFDWVVPLHSSLVAMRQFK